MARLDGPGTPPPLDLPADHVRLLTKVARMYHERQMRQPEIAERLHMSQPRVSRLLKEATEVGIVRTTVLAPRGTWSELEEQLEQQYGLSEVVVADTEGSVDEAEVLPAIAAAAAAYLDTTLTGGDRIGISSWSSTLLAAVDGMRPRSTPVAEKVVQILGGVGTTSAQTHATRLTGRLAQITHGEAVYLLAPGLLGSPAMRRAFLNEPNVAAVLHEYEQLTLALVGVGSLDPSELLRESGNAIAEADQAQLLRDDAVGDICLRFFDSRGRHVRSGLDKRILGIDPGTFRAIPRRVGVAGGQRKWRAIRAAVEGGWLTVLVTDLHTAEQLLAPTP